MAAVRDNALAKHLPDGVTPADRVLALASLGLTAGLVSTLTQLGFVFGCAQSLQRTYDPARCLQLIQDDRISVMANVPVFLELMLREPSFGRTDLSTLRHATTGGATVTLELLRAYAEQGVQLAQSYGLTEAGIFVATMPGDEVEGHLGSAGRAVMHGEIRIVDDEDRELPPTEAGEIIYRGPGIMREYWNQPDATASTLRGGWLHTGDVGTLDAEGYLTVCDRKKDMIRSGGLNVYPAEVERVLGGIPGFEDIAVVGVPDDRWDEVGMLVIGASAVVADLDVLREVCAAHLASYKHPHHVVRLGDALPRNASGKIRKVDLRERFPVPPPDAVSLR